jgi:hypothetical protein
MDRIVGPDPRRGDGAVNELARLEARNLGISGGKGFRELLHRIEIDVDRSRMQGDDVRLGHPSEGRLPGINLGRSISASGSPRRAS